MSWACPACWSSPRVVMRDNLAELSTRGLASRWPVLLGGAALTRAYVEQDLAALFDGEVRYARDAFEGLRLMDAFMAVKRGAGRGAAAADCASAAVRTGARLQVTEPDAMPARSDVATDTPVPAPPFFGDRIVKGIPLTEYAAFLDERATFMGQWGLKPGRGKDGPSYAELVETEGQATAADVAGSRPERGTAPGRGGVRLLPGGQRRERPGHHRRRRDRAGTVRVPAAASRPASVPGRLLPPGGFRRHRRGRLPAGHRGAGHQPRHRGTLRQERLPRVPGAARALGPADRGPRGVLARPGPAGDRASTASDPADLDGILKVGYRGCRYSFGYPACPDLEDRAKVVRLLRPERIGVALSEEFQLEPEQSTDALITFHPEAKYFSA